MLESNLLVRLDTHLAGLHWTSDQLVAGDANYTTHHKYKGREWYLNGIRNRDPNKQATADLRPRPHGHQDRLLSRNNAFI